MKTLKIVIAGGGTGGHITPSLAVAHALPKDAEIHFIGENGGMEAQLVADAGYSFHGIVAGKLRRYADMRNLTDGFRIITGFFQALTLLKELKPHVVFSKGGYVAVPVAYAANWLGIPVVTHESDAVMGLANRLIANAAKAICTGFPAEHFSESLRSKIHVTGNPIRELMLQKLPSHAELVKKYDLEAALPVIFIMGGSQGALPVNQLVWNALPVLLKEAQIIHLTGENHIQLAQDNKATLSKKIAHRYRPYGFVGPELPELLSLADIAVSRASASSVAELAIMKKPSILIPLPSAASDHQRANARVLERAGAALVLEQTTLTDQVFQEKILTLLKDSKAQRTLAWAIEPFADPEAAHRIARLVQRTAEKSR